jgi:hypothetical protein
VSTKAASELCALCVKLIKEKQSVSRRRARACACACVSANPKIPPVVRIGVIDWTAGALLSASVLTWPKIDGSPDQYKLLWQMALAGSS